MDEEIERLVIGVRADSAGFARDVSAMRDTLQGSLGDGAATAGRRIETALARAARTGKLGFDDLKSTALSALGAIEESAVRSAVGGGSAGSLASGLVAIASGLLGAPGRATGGPVSPNRPYLVGERGPELFVPTAAGRVETGAAPSPARDVRVSITVNAGGGDAGGALQRSSKQVARAVRAAIVGAGS